MCAFSLVALLVMLHASCGLVDCDVPDPGDADFALSTYCLSMCKWGRGGNLCKCHAAYFAGKRSSASSGGSSGGRSRVAAETGMLTDDDEWPPGNEHVWAELVATRRPPTKLSSGVKRRDADVEMANNDVARHCGTAAEELRPRLRSASSTSLRKWP